MPELSIIGRFRHSFCMNTERSMLIEAIHSSGHKAAIVITGGGSGAAHALLSHPGASRLVLELQIPYSDHAMFDYLGKEIGPSCSEEAAITMAGRAFERAVVFSLRATTPSSILGIACTAALQTTRERKGADRACICIKSRKDQVVYKIEFNGGDRFEQEERLTEELLNCIAAFLGVDEQ